MAKSVLGSVLRLASVTVLLSALLSGCTSGGGSGPMNPAAKADMSVAPECATMKCENPSAICCGGEPCIDVLSNTQHCGGCGKTCPMNMIACLNGACTNAICHAIGYSKCPSGATQWCDTKPISATDEAQAKLACETCYGKTCYRETADCAGVGYGPQPTGMYVCADPYWGAAAGCSGVAGRVWSICGSYTTYGMWAN